MDDPKHGPDAPSEIAPTDPIEVAPTQVLAQCSCGTDRDSKFAVAHLDYTFLGTLYLLWGGTSIPSKVTFRCVRCGETFDTATRPSVCRRYVV